MAIDFSSIPSGFSLQWNGQQPHTATYKDGILVGGGNIDGSNR
jgi:hypothetical protein